ncbi:MAG: hypothetical protein LUF33_04285 [Clostridiales bacterium]|nr:hypothetical protein [Clostridiales bacterium]
MKKISVIICSVLMLMISVVPAFALISPQVDDLEYSVTVVDTTGGTDKYTFTSEIDEDGNQNVTIWAEIEDGYTFDYWDISGSYTTDDDLTDSEMNLVITSDITVTPHYLSDTEETTAAAGSSSTTATTATTTTTVTTDTSATSPKTGADDAVLYAVILLALAGCGAIVTKLVKASK